MVPACAVATLMPSNIKAKPAADIAGALVRESLPSLTATSHPGINPLVVPPVDLLCTISVVSEYRQRRHAGENVPFAFFTFILLEANFANWRA